jgi:hypothetical protein
MKSKGQKHLSLEEPFEIPTEGMLGLLAYGAEGLLAWREKRAQIEGKDWRKKLAAELSVQAGDAAQAAGEDENRHG